MFFSITENNAEYKIFYCNKIWLKTYICHIFMSGFFVTVEQQHESDK